MVTEIHTTAVVDPGAAIGENVVIGPFALIEKNVEIGNGCHIGPYTRVSGPTKIGKNNHFESHGSVGAAPQDLKFDGAPTRLEIGDNNTFREFITLHRGTTGGGGITRINNNNLFMAYAHVAHDCLVGSDTIFANSATLAGHVEIGDFATIGAFSAVHQFCRVGEYAFLGGFTVATKDCLPYMRIAGSRPAKCYGPNAIGLERRGFSAERRRALKRAWRYLHSKKMTTSEAIERIKEELSDSEEVNLVLNFIESAERGVILARG